GQSIRVTLRGSLGDVLIDKKTKQTCVCPVILSATCPKKYDNKVYLSSTSSTVIYDDDAIPVIKALKKSITYKVTIDGIRTRKGWKFPSCRSNTYKKALTHQYGQFFCQSCNKTVNYPILRYRLEVDVSDNTTQAVVVMFNETATALVNCSAHSLICADIARITRKEPKPDKNGHENGKRTQEPGIYQQELKISQPWLTHVKTNP
nr:hypothetical protein [Tanacetum cinerariifolium]